VEYRGEFEQSQTRVEVLGFRGADGFVFALVDPTKRSTGGVNDAYYPWPDYGYVWLREQDEMWVASGKVNARLIGDRPAAADGILDFIVQDLLGLGEQVASCIEGVETHATHVFSNEEGHMTFKGSGGTHWGMSAQDS
jgi:hypothetical protein